MARAKATNQVRGKKVKSPNGATTGTGHAGNEAISAIPLGKHPSMATLPKTKHAGND